MIPQRLMNPTWNRTNENKRKNELGSRETKSETRIYPKNYIY